MLAEERATWHTQGLVLDDVRTASAPPRSAIPAPPSSHGLAIVASASASAPASGCFLLSGDESPFSTY
jgi:hypothetical protein